jgi:hypothetical protein
MPFKGDLPTIEEYENLDRAVENRGYEVVPAEGHLSVEHFCKLCVAAP